MPIARNETEPHRNHDSAGYPEGYVGGKTLLEIFNSREFAEKMGRLVDAQDNKPGSFTVAGQGSGLFFSPDGLPPEFDYIPEGRGEYTTILKVVGHGQMEEGNTSLVPRPEDVNLLTDAAFVAVVEKGRYGTEMIVLGHDGKEQDLETVRRYLEETKDFSELPFILNRAHIPHTRIRFPAHMFSPLPREAKYGLSTLMSFRWRSQDPEITDSWPVVVGEKQLNLMFENPNLLKAIRGIMIPSSKAGTDTHITVHIDLADDKKKKESPGDTPVLINPGVVRSGARQHTSGEFYAQIREPTLKFGTLARITLLGETEKGDEARADEDWPPVPDGDTLRDMFNTGYYIAMRYVTGGDEMRLNTVTNTVDHSERLELAVYRGIYRRPGAINTAVENYTKLSTESEKLQFLERMGFLMSRYSGQFQHTGSKRFVRYEAAPAGESVSPVTVHLYTSHR